MQAKVTKWCEGERIMLADVVPLDTPISLLVEPSSACNFKCFYCPHGLMAENRSKYGNLNKVMDFPIFEKLIEDSKRFPKRIKAINFSRFGEPLLNKRLPEMINLAKRNDACEVTKVITNGSVLTPELNLKLISAGLDVLRISVQGLTNQQISDTCGFNLDFDNFVSNIRHFYNNRGRCKLFIKIIDEIIKGSEDVFFKIFGDICDEISIEHLIDADDYMALEDKGKKRLTNMMCEIIDNVDVCSSPFYSLNICANGNISPCCSDLEEKIVFGNVMTDSIFDIWDSKKMNAFRVMQLKGCRYTHQVCRVCTGPTYAKQTRDNIDSCRERLLEYYKDKL